MAENVYKYIYIFTHESSLSRILTLTLALYIDLNLNSARIWLSVGISVIDRLNLYITQTNSKCTNYINI